MHIKPNIHSLQGRAGGGKSLQAGATYPLGKSSPLVRQLWVSSTRSHFTPCKRLRHFHSNRAAKQTNKKASSNSHWNPNHFPFPIYLYAYTIQHILLRSWRSHPKLFLTHLLHANQIRTCKYSEHEEKLLKSLWHYLHPKASGNLYASRQVLSVKAEVIIRKYESRCHFWQVEMVLYSRSRWMG